MNEIAHIMNYFNLMFYKQSCKRQLIYIANSAYMVLYG